MCVARGDLQGKVALVSGGTAGVGLEAARRLAARGAAVLITGRTKARGEEALEQLGATSSDVRFVLADAGDPAEMAGVVESLAAEHGGGIDILISAGAGHEVGPMPLAEMSAEDIRIAFDTRFYPRIFPVHAAIPALRVRGGSVVMLTTDAARYPTPGECVMGAAGAAVILMTKAMARELSRWHIRVNSVSMTITSDTPSWDRIFADASFQNRLFSKAVERFPQGRPPTAGEVADVVTFLACDESAQVSGQTLSANGGLSFGGW